MFPEKNAAPNAGYSFIDSILDIILPVAYIGIREVSLPEKQHSLYWSI